MESVLQVNEYFLNDIHSLSPVSPECKECGEINVSIPSMVVLWTRFSEICYDSLDPKQPILPAEDCAGLLRGLHS